MTLKAYCRLLLAASCPIAILAESSVPHSDGTQEYEAEIKVAADVVANATATPETVGWHATNVCFETYCVWSNKQVGGGRGLVIVTTPLNVEKIKALEERMMRAEKFQLPEVPPYEVAKSKDGTVEVVAREPLKRGTRLTPVFPVLAVQKRVIHDLPAAERDRLLEAAVAELPEPARTEFREQQRGLWKGQGQRVGGGGAGSSSSSSSARDVIMTHPYEADLGEGRNKEPGDHHVYFGAPGAFSHDCRPNLAFYVSGTDLTLRATVARKTWPGEPLTLSRFDPMMPRAERQEMHHLWKGEGHDCPCARCTGSRDPGGLLGSISKSDANLDEIAAIEKELAQERPKVTSDMAKRLVKLYKEEGLETKLAKAYEAAAIAFNYLGYYKRAQKHAELSRLAWIVEDGPDSNRAVAMRILAQDPKAHYSFRYLAKKGVKTERKLQ